MSSDERRLADAAAAVQVPDVLDTPAAGRLVIRGGALRAGGYVAGAVLGLVSVPLLTRALGPGEFGRFVTVVSLVTLAGAIAEAGMTNFATREYAQRTGADRERLLRSLLGLRLALLAAGLAAALAFAVAAGYPGRMVLGTAVAGLGIAIASLQGAYGVALAAGLVLGRLTVADLVRQALTVAAIVLVAALGGGLVAFAATPVAGAVAALALTVGWVRGRMPLGPTADLRAWREVLGVVGAFALAAAVGTLYVYVIQLVLSVTAPELETGYFSASFRIFLVIASLAGTLAAAAFPVLARAARDDAERLSYAVGRLADVCLLLGAGGGVACLLGAPVAVDVLAGPGYEPAVPVLRIHAAAVLCSFVLAAWGFALVSLHGHRGLLVANAAALVVGVAAALVLGSASGARGGAVATVLGELTLAAGYAIAVRRLRPGLPLLGARAPRVAVAALAALAVALVPGLPPLADALAGVAVFGAVALALRAVPDELLEALPGRAR